MLILSEEEQAELRKDDAVLIGRINIDEIHELSFHNPVSISGFGAVLNPFDERRMVYYSGCKEDADKVEPAAWPISKTLILRGCWVQVRVVDLGADDLQADFAV